MIIHRRNTWWHLDGNNNNNNNNKKKRVVRPQQVRRSIIQSGSETRWMAQKIELSFMERKPTQVKVPWGKPAVTVEKCSPLTSRKVKSIPEYAIIFNKPQTNYVSKFGNRLGIEN